MRKVLVTLLIIAFLVVSAGFFIMGYLERQNSALESTVAAESSVAAMGEPSAPVAVENESSVDMPAVSLPAEEPVATPVPTPEPTPFVGLQVEDNSNFELEEDVDYVFH